MESSKKKTLVVLTGAGISAESGIETYRDENGLWNKVDPREVASIEAWENNPKTVLQLFNERRKAVALAQPNPAHLALVELEKYFEVAIVTQNVDNFHERAGSSYVTHLHGDNSKVRSSENPLLIYDWGDQELKLGDQCEQGSQLRPHVVLFGEAVPMMATAKAIVGQADILLIVGTSLVVYPAASLVEFVKEKTPIYVVDPNIPASLYVGAYKKQPMHFFQEKASTGVPKVVEVLLADENLSK